ncbi:hypothetical protein H5410_040834 [Solanum commersonii]|uniref:Uncharacterized protein n=1 Tax=Solanum commersonii TaxID=4109 RepID=A0A9J5XT30_SOLCO|nr:hypothetical protein H5410_040834 [Solanum commersonii]
MIPRVKCWTSNFVSYRGRLQLIKSVLIEMQTYWAQILLSPKKIITMGTTVCRTFLWTGSNNFSRKALVAWDKISMPKAVGGLSVIGGHLWNKAALSALLWVIGQKKDKLWIVWIHIFYIKRKDLYTMTIPKQAYDARPTGGRKKPEASIKNNYMTLRP